MFEGKNPWQKGLIQAITNPKELLEFLELDMDLLPKAIEVSKLFPLKVTKSFAARMQKNNRYDPLLLQVLPIDLEEEKVPGFTQDPLSEKSYNLLPGLLHKYQSRVLLTMTGLCGIHCRYCFRREFPYSANNPGKEGWSQVLNYIQQDTSIQEVILSGGDPLTLSDHLLSNFAAQLETTPHIKRLRFHTRMPIILPERINEEFMGWLTNLSLKKIIVIHCNHPNEINNEVRIALEKLKNNGITLLNQSVLLKGVNDSSDTLCELSEKLFEAGVIPYYLHLLDKVQGSAHFDVDVETAQALHKELHARLSGYLVPRLVKEQPGAPGKVNLF